MPTQPQDATSSSRAPTQKPWFIPLLGSIAVLLVLLLLLLLVTNSFRMFFSIFYSPFAFAVMLIIVLEYIILKGVDRSRIYRLEIERLRSKRAEDIALWRELERHLSDALAHLENVGDAADSSESAAHLSSLGALRSKIEEILAILRKKT